LAEEERKISNDDTLETEVKPVEDLETVKQALAEEKAKSERYLANWQRVEADFINYKKHVEQEKMEAINFAYSTLILRLLPIMDDLERAFVSLPTRLANNSWVRGIKLIYDKLKGILQGQGLTEIKAKGEPFDPHMHEAVVHGEGEEGIIIAEIQKGYKLKGRVIRPSMVVVGKGKEGGETEEEKGEM
jgi:molecular chaperone GrpE